MKFGKLLADQLSEVPSHMKPKFLSYKELKKQLKGISPGTPACTYESDEEADPAGSRAAAADGATTATTADKNTATDSVDPKPSPSGDAPGGSGKAEGAERAGGPEGAPGAVPGFAAAGADGSAKGEGERGGEPAGGPPSDGAAADSERRKSAGGSEGPAAATTTTTTNTNNNNRLTVEEGTFVSKLNLEIIKFNDYFIKREEELIIRVKDLCDSLKSAATEDERVALRSASVHLHGEMVLLLHWCELNYIGLVKILKKHDKKTGLLLRSPYLANVVRQPFCSTTILKRLLKEVEDIIFTISPESRPAAQQQQQQASGETNAAVAGDVTAKREESHSAKTNTSGSIVDELDEMPHLSTLDSMAEDEEGDFAVAGSLLKQTKVAINLWRELQKSKTPGGQMQMPMPPRRGSTTEGSVAEEQRRPKKAKTDPAA